jgi:ABC-type transporter Mla MlaB component
MPIKVVGNEISLSGNLNEQFDMGEVKKSIEANTASFSEKVVLNFKEVPRANSCGIATLLKTLTQVQVPVEFVHCPTWLVDQLNQIDEFFQIPLKVKSVYAPYMDPNAHDYTLRLVHISDGFLSTSDYENIESFVNEAGQNLTADFDKDDYFSFLQNVK